MQLYPVPTFDLDSPANIERFVKAFYVRVLRDSELAPIFLEVAKIDLDKHLPLICRYWEKLLLGNPSYQRHTMNIHRDVHKQQPFTDEHFSRWLTLFVSTCDDLCCGPFAEKAKRTATRIAGNMARNVTPSAKT
jgi:hemoglobin